MSEKTNFFTHDREFYRTLFGMLAAVSLQNLIAYSVNMADNIMLGSYGQNALSGAATVNQIFFLVQMLASSIGSGLTVLASQYWGRHMTGPIRSITGISVRLSVLLGIIVVIICGIIPRQILLIFTSDEMILSEGLAYMSIIKWTFILYMVTTVLYCALRSVETVRISFVISAVSLVINVLVNYILIFGHAGFEPMGIRGAAIGTFIARTAELLLVIVYMTLSDRKLRLTFADVFRREREHYRDYFNVTAPVMASTMLWSISVPLQTAILGHISSDAIAANSVASTFYQTLKVVVNAMASVSGVMIGKSIGEGNLGRIKSDGRTLSVLDILMGTVLGILLILLRGPLLSMYNLSDTAMVLSDHLIVIMGLVMISMSYQMSVSSGIIQGAGDIAFAVKLNLISTWLIVMPLSFMAAFWWKWPVEAVVLAIQSDQFFKCIPVFIRFRSYKWIHDLTRKEKR